jgi:hypothetical protein
MKRIYHMHHIVPKHMGGTDDPSNLKKVTIRQHALEHKKLYEKYGKWEDNVAWLSLSKQISCAMATKIAQSLANKIKTPSQLKAANRNRQLALKAWTGAKHKKETLKKISKANKKYWGNMPHRPWQLKTYIVEGKEYKGLEQLMKKFKLTMPALYYRFNSNNFPGWNNKGGFKDGR